MDFNFTGQNASQYGNRLSKRSRQLIGIVIAALILLTVFAIISSFRFHVVSTDPSTNNFSPAAPYISFNFNQTLSSRDLVVTSNPSIISADSVNGKTLVVNIFAADISLNKQYTITLKSVYSSSGKHLANQSFVFTAKNIPFTSMSKAQQQAALQQQATVPYTRDSITFVGTDVLINNGVSTSQLEDMKQAFYNYSKTIHQQFSKVTIEVSSVATPPYNPNNPTPPTVTFDVQIGSNNFNAKLVNPSLTSAELYLYTPQTSSLVYDSGNIDFSTLN